MAREPPVHRTPSRSTIADPPARSVPVVGPSALGHQWLSRILAGILADDRKLADDRNRCLSDVGRRRRWLPARQISGACRAHHSEGRTSNDEKLQHRDPLSSSKRPTLHALNECPTRHALNECPTLHALNE